MEPSWAEKRMVGQRAEGSELKTGSRGRNCRLGVRSEVLHSVLRGLGRMSQLLDSLKVSHDTGSSAVCREPEDKPGRTDH